VITPPTPSVRTEVEIPLASVHVPEIRGSLASKTAMVLTV